MPRVLQGEVLEFSLFCNDQQTCLANFMQQPNLLIPMCMHEPTAYLIICHLLYTRAYSADSPYYI